MQDNYLNHYKEKILIKLEELENKVAQTGNEEQIAEVRRYRESIQNNALMADFANSDGMKILLEYIRLEKKTSLSDILNASLFFKNEEEYFRKVKIAWLRISQVDWFLELLTGREEQLETWDQTLNDELGIKDGEEEL